ncbi:unnamed protein product [Candidula unifasciata]|uniref:Multiple inositol polyphosphate phosphatase 1 n=1 Tax=Candidula unifasciata TaxID=100452 RepID=A0A8S3YGA2_9EUPU|nr:unnamed protein product [Candidula unifasciata]
MAAAMKLHSAMLFYILVYMDLFSFTISTLPNKYFSTKTPYAWTHPVPKPVEDELYYLKDIKGKACSAVHASAVIRHGARYPGLDDVQEISAVHDKLVLAMEPNINPELYNWVNRFPSNNNKALSSLGESEQEALGRRIATKLSTLFSDEDTSNFRFLVSSQERTKQSAAAFYEGFSSTIYGGEEAEDDFDSEVNDQLLRFFSLCAKYVFSVESNKTAFKEYFDFLSNERVVRIKEKIDKKLDIGPDVLTTANIRLIYLVCGYETAVYDSSPWCSLLDESDMEILEYLGDLKHYYKNGYGYNITWQQSCPLVSEIFATMDETIMDIENADDGEEPGGLLVGQFAFGHAETLGPLYSALGLFNDTLPLRADNYHQQSQRLFRTSNILPFSGNILFVLYECVPDEFGEDEEIEEADYYLRMFVNEEPALIPGCEELYCPYNVVRDYYHDFVDQCHFKKLCQRSEVKDEL